MKKPQKPTNVADALTSLIVEVFRLNGALLAAGDRLVGGLGLTSARWQVLGAIDAGKAALTISQVARNMGLSRQAVQRLANEMAEDGLVAFTPNPHHARAKLLVMTTRGKAVFQSAMSLQRSWAATIGQGLETGEIDKAAAVLATVRQKLKG